MHVALACITPCCTFTMTSSHDSCLARSMPGYTNTSVHLLSSHSPVCYIQISIQTRPHPARFPIGCQTTVSFTARALVANTSHRHQQTILRRCCHRRRGVGRGIQRHRVLEKVVASSNACFASLVGHSYIAPND